MSGGPAPVALLSAAELYVDQVLRRRNILLRQLQLHVNAYAPAEVSRSVNGGTAAVGGPFGSPGRQAAAAGGPGHALKSSVVRLAQQLRKEGVRLVEAAQLVRTSQSRLKELQRQQRAADGAADGGAARDRDRGDGSSVFSAASTVDVDALLARMLADTDMVARSNDLVRARARGGCAVLCCGLQAAL